MDHTNNAFVDELQGLWHSATGEAITVEGFEYLARRQEIETLRVLTLEDPGSFILKRAYHADEAGQGLPASFAAERLHYGFLMGCREVFSWFPRLLAQGNHWFALEDLGGHVPPHVPIRRVLVLLSRALVHLHMALAPFEADYEARRAAAGFADDERYFSEAGNQRLVETACTYLMQQGINPGLLQDLLEDVDRISSIIQQPGPFRAFIHDDLSNHRQTIARGAELYLIDWERARYGHTLLDLGKLLVGKYEYHIDEDVFRFVDLEFPTRLARMYREVWEERRGLRVPDDVWLTQLRAALVYSAFIEVGHVVTRQEEWDIGERLGDEVGKALGKLRYVLGRLDHASWRGVQMALEAWPE